MTSATAVSVVQPRGSGAQREHAPLCTRITESTAVMVPTRAMRGAQRRGLTEELELSRHHRDEEQQHGDVAWTEPTSTPPRGRSQLPFSNAFEFGGERHGVLMLCGSPTRWAQRRRVRESSVSVCRYVLISLLGGWYVSLVADVASVHALS